MNKFKIVIFFSQFGSALLFSERPNSGFFPQRDETWPTTVKLCLKKIDIEQQAKNFYHVANGGFSQFTAFRGTELIKIQNSIIVWRFIANVAKLNTGSKVSEKRSWGIGGVTEEGFKLLRLRTAPPLHTLKLCSRNSFAESHT